MLILKRGTPNEEGFTLLELVVVILILGLLFGVALPRLYRPVDTGPLRLGATRLAEAIRRVRIYTASEGRLVRMRFTLPEGKWAIEGLNGKGAWIELPDPPVEKGRIPDGVNLRRISIGGRRVFSRGDVSLRFFPSGETEKAEFYLIDRTLEERTLFVHPYYNQVEIFHGRAEKKRS